MNLSFDDWKEYAWRLDAAEGPGPTTFERIDARVWRVTASSTAGGQITFSYGPPIPSNTIVNVPAGGTFVCEPFGMTGRIAITFDSGIDQWTVEWIRRLQAAK